MQKAIMFLDPADAGNQRQSECQTNISGQGGIMEMIASDSQNPALW